MIIIVEGPDLAGKTTFVTRLRNRVGPGQMDLIKSGVPVKGMCPFKEYEQQIYDYTYHLSRRIKHHLICDRFHWGEMVYGRLLRGDSRFDEAGWRHIEMFLASQGAVVVYLHQPTEVLEQRYDKRGDDTIPRRMLMDINHHFGWCLDNTILPTIMLRDPDDTDISRVIDFARGRTQIDFPTYIGIQRPKALLFGDTRNDNDFISAFVPRPGTSGNYLLHALPNGIWGHIGILNAAEADDIKVTHNILSTTTRHADVALGQKASNILYDNNIPHSTVPHPQYIRRSLFDYQEMYGRLITKAMYEQSDYMWWRGEDIDAI